MNHRNDEDICRELELETGKIDGTWRPILGSVLLSLATVLCFIAAISGTELGDLQLMSNMSRAYSLMGALILAVLAVILLRQPREARDPQWQPDQPGLRFDSVVLYTRAGCHLCHQALDTLLLHSEFLTAISEVDIDSDPELIERYGNLVPVVVIDGRERFRGQVNVLLLRRLIDATLPHTPLQ